MCSAGVQTLSSTGPVSAQTISGAQTPFSSIDVSGLGLPSESYSGAVLAHNEHIYFVPWSADNILELNPETGALNPIDISQHATTFFQLGAGSNKYAGGVLAPNGHIYLVPFNAKGILDFDPASGNSSMIDISGTGSDTSKYIQGVLAPNGHIYMCPHTVSYLCI